MQMESDPPFPENHRYPGRLFSVGHSNQELSQLVALLCGAGVTAVADVRSAPLAVDCGSSTASR